MWRISRARSKSAAGPVTIMRPLRSTEMRSAWLSASSSACEMKIIATPLRRSDPHQVEQMVGLLRRERGGRLIEDDDARLVEHGARDLHHLPLRRRQRAGKLRGIDLEVQPLQHLPGGVANLAHRVEGALAAEHDVLRHGELRHQAGLLVDHRDAEAAGVLRRGEGGDLSVDVQHALRRRDDAGDQFAERRFAGAVLAHQRMDLAGIQVEIGIGQRGDAAIGLGRPSPAGRSVARSWLTTPGAEVEDFPARLAHRDQFAVPQRQRRMIA